jgi:glucosamine kinase
MKAMVGNLIFCVEGGGTKSRARLVDTGGTTRAEAEGGPCNPSTGLDRALATFNKLWRHCAATAGFDPHEFGDVVLSIGAAGLYIPTARAKFLAATPRFAQSFTSSDGYAALIGASEGKPCGLIVMGTGAAGHRLWPNGLSAQRDGWGWIGGDRGSGVWLGIKAVRHTLAVIDGAQRRDGLSDSVLASVGGRARLSVMMSGVTPDQLAALAPVVLGAAAKGIPAAVDIRQRAIEHLTALAGVLDIGDDDTLYATGGLAAIFTPHVSKRLGHDIATPKSDAMRGCYLIATGRAPAERVVDEVAQVN